MNAADRLNLLKVRYNTIRKKPAAALFGIALAGSLATASQKEVKEVVCNIKSSVARSMDDSIIDEEKAEALPSTLPFDQAEEVLEIEDAIYGDGENSGILSKREREQLARDMAPLKAFKQIVRNTPPRLTWSNN